MGEKNYHTTKYTEEEWLLKHFPVEERNSVKAILHEASNLNVTGSVPKHSVWSRVQSQLPEARVVSMRPMMYKVMAVAASLLFVVTCVSVLVLGNIETVTPYAQNKVVYLPDGSEVILNADTRLSYNKYLWNFKRSVQLEGEAFFQVQKGETFDVVTDDKMVSVLGTSFNVLARPYRYEVACFTGKVRVADEDDQVILTPGLSTAIYSEKLEVPNSFDQKSVASWKRGDFYFDNTPLDEVFAIMELQFDVRVDVQLTQRFYTGYFDKSSLEAALNVVCSPMNLSYQVDGNQITIKENKP